MRKSYHFATMSLETAEYYVIELSAGTKHWTLCPTDSGPKLSDVFCRTMQLWLRRIPAGTFQMGSPNCEIGRHDNEHQRLVSITHDFLIGIFPVTQRQWEIVMGDNPAYFKDAGPCAPVEQVTYMDICGGSRRWP
ncbi:MAG: SUMF1/EgtB/PvdO family nonheme iron enzyme, partial [Victivallales bacterium]|nr:SUMF1/EgtB/PvdO family nonheme iron enzyme [Victivallales bacterium]